MPVDRLGELQAAARSSKFGKNPHQVPRNAGGPRSKDTLEMFLGRMGEVKMWIDKVEENMLEIHSMQKKALMIAHRDDHLERRLANLISENKALARQIRSSIRREEDQMASLQQQSKGSQDLNMRRNQINCQLRRFLKIWNEYNANQIQFRDKSKERLVKRCKIMNNNLTEDQIEALLDSGGSSALFFNSILEEERLARQQAADLQDRHDEFIKLEKSILEIHNLFIDMSNLVSEQGEIIDSVSANVNSAHINIESGEEHLKDAKIYQQSARKKRILCYFLLFLVFVAIVLILLKIFNVI